MNNDELQRVLKEARANGEYPNLREADLSGANLREADLSWADLSEADLSWADLSGADLRGADLSWADLSWAYLRGADLSGANLSGANLSEADLSGADLSGANLWGARGNNKEIKSLHIFEEYDVSYTFDRLQIGCENHAMAEWWNFEDKRILQMGGKKALNFWRKNKELIKQIIEHSPATGKES